MYHIPPHNRPGAQDTAKLFASVRDVTHLNNASFGSPYMQYTCLSMLLCQVDVDTCGCVCVCVCRCCLHNDSPADCASSAFVGISTPDCLCVVCCVCRCCLHNDSPADCASTASKLKGCRSDSSCVPEGDPCAAASNETGCMAVGPFCK